MNLNLHSFMSPARQYVPSVELNLKTGAKLAGLVVSLWSGYYLVKIWRSYGFFKKLGIKTPPPRFIFGNHLEILRKTHSLALRDWTEKYGKTYGYYEGHKPILVTSDMELIQEVFVRQFANFVARKEFSFQFTDDSPSSNLFLSTRTRWKRMRNILNPAFSMAKLKELMPIITSICQKLTAHIEANAGKELCLTDLLDQYTMDSICCCSFGIDPGCLNNPTNRFFTNCIQYFTDLQEFGPMTALMTYFNELRPYLLQMMAVSTFFVGGLQNLPFFSNMVDPLMWLVQNINQIIDQRVQSKIVRKDLIQVLLQSHSEEPAEAGSEKKTMTLLEIKWNVVGFLLAGLELTSSAFKIFLFLLAIYPEEQQKLQDEVDSYLNSLEPGSTEPDVESLLNLPYMDIFIKEALRMYPISNTVTTRRCTTPTEVKGIKIPVGLSVTIDVLALHYDPELYGPVDPNIFYPSRFAPECKRNPLAFFAFGAGPRNCVGQKLAQVEMKLSLLKILSRFNVRRCASTPAEITFTEGISRRVHDDIIVVFEPRTAPQ